MYLLVYVCIHIYIHAITSCEEDGSCFCFRIGRCSKPPAVLAGCRSPLDPRISRIFVLTHVKPAANTVRETGNHLNQASQSFAGGSYCKEMKWLESNA